MDRRDVAFALLLCLGSLTTTAGTLMVWVGAENPIITWFQIALGLIMLAAAASVRRQ